MTAPHAGPVLALGNLDVAYRDAASGAWRAAVTDVSLAIQPGEIVALVGESGSGKSTTAAALIGLLPDNAQRRGGSIELEGVELAHAPESVWQDLRGRRIGFVPQDPGLSLDPVKRIGTQLEEALTVHGVSKAEARRRVPGILADVGLADVERVARSFPHELSGGMRQRVLIGMAVAHEPALIIADEPTSALDVTVQRQVLDHLEALVRRKGIAVLLITHDLGVAFDRADRVAVMQGGRIVETGAARPLRARPAHPYTQTLLAAAPGLRQGGPPAPARPAGHAPLLVVQNLAKRFGEVRAVDGVSFHVPRHGTTSLVGESGSGKSTTSRIALCLERPDAGQVWFDGRDVTRLSRGQLQDFRRRVQVVYQNPYASLNPRFTLEAIITEPLHAFGLGDRASRRERAAELLHAVELSPDLLDSRPARLSGGQRQRVAIARALAIEPELVVLDEPVSALDVSVQARILALLQRLQADLGVSYLFVSHDLAVVRQISDHVVVLRRGQVAEQGPVEQVFERPTHPYTQALLGDTPGGRHALAAVAAPAPLTLDLAA
ncbi:ABC transporter ATP-binding protein [Achromobacter sp. DH1f]|uniref:dipeptide ABC transporter ATP-binding protein n=1 Tax=Achromobacter sp. DH1f TaxID=1397275 RepID=UPI000468396B|nr:ABC transporter ATP-binding protein [Achromobacter sp. DH1f]